MLSQRAGTPIWEESGLGCRGREPGRHEPLLGKHEPPSFGRQTEPPPCRNEHALYIKMCLRNTGGFLNLSLNKSFFLNFKRFIKNAKYLLIIINSA